jgi:hypothetical protein
MFLFFLPREEKDQPVPSLFQLTGEARLYCKPGEEHTEANLFSLPREGQLSACLLY